MPSARPLSLRPARPTFQVIHYANLRELRLELESHERTAGQDLVVVLILDEWFAGSLVSLVRRRQMGGTLIATAAPGSATRIGLAGWPASPAECGWRHLAAEPDLARAMTRAASFAAGEQPVVVFAPASLQPSITAALCGASRSPGARASRMAS